MRESRIRNLDVETLTNYDRVLMAKILRAVEGSAMPIKFWYVDANIAASGDGTEPTTAFKTIDEAITACSNSADDWILVFDYSGSTATITINKSWVHLIGFSNMGEYPYPRIKPSNDVPGITLANGASGIEICNFKIGGNTNAAGIYCGVGAASYVTVHDCVFGADTATACQHALEIASGGDIPQLVFRNNWIGDSCTGPGILVSGVVTRGHIRDNVFMNVGVEATPAISFAGGTWTCIEGNRIQGQSDDATGWGITLAAACDSFWINNNYANKGLDAAAFNPYVDGGSTNSWGMNYQDIRATLPAAS